MCQPRNPLVTRQCHPVLKQMSRHLSLVLCSLLSVRPSTRGVLLPGSPSFIHRPLADDSSVTLPLDMACWRVSLLPLSLLRAYSALSAAVNRPSRGRSCLVSSFLSTPAGYDKGMDCFQSLWDQSGAFLRVGRFIFSHSCITFNALSEG